MFVRWVNLPQCKDKQLDYSQFLQALGRFQDIPEQEKVRRECIRAQVLLLLWPHELAVVVVSSPTVVMLPMITMPRDMLLLLHALNPRIRGVALWTAQRSRQEKTGLCSSDPAVVIR